MSLRVWPEQKALLVRAAALQRIDLTNFVLRAAEVVIEAADQVGLSEWDSALVLDLLERPPVANDRLRAAAKELPLLG